MNVFIKGNDILLSCDVPPDQFANLVHLHNLGKIHVSVEVYHGERVGFLPMNDIDLSRTMKKLSEDEHQLVLPI